MILAVVQVDTHLAIAGALHFIPVLTAAPRLPRALHTVPICLSPMAAWAVRCVLSAAMAPSTTSPSSMPPCRSFRTLHGAVDSTITSQASNFSSFLPRLHCRHAVEEATAPGYAHLMSSSLLQKELKLFAGSRVQIGTRNATN